MSPTTGLGEGRPRELISLFGYQLQSPTETGASEGSTVTAEDRGTTIRSCPTLPVRCVAALGAQLRMLKAQILEFDHEGVRMQT